MWLYHLVPPLGAAGCWAHCGAHPCHGPQADATLGTHSGAHTLFPSQVWGLIHSFYKYSLRRYCLSTAALSTGIHRRQDCPQGADLTGEDRPGVGARREDSLGRTGEACTQA